MNFHRIDTQSTTVEHAEPDSRRRQNQGNVFKRALISPCSKAAYTQKVHSEEVVLLSFALYMELEKEKLRFFF